MAEEATEVKDVLRSPAEDEHQIFVTKAPKKRSFPKQPLSPHDGEEDTSVRPRQRKSKRPESRQSLTHDAEYLTETTTRRKKKNTLSASLRNSRSRSVHLSQELVRRSKSITDTNNDGTPLTFAQRGIASTSERELSWSKREADQIRPCPSLTVTSDDEESKQEASIVWKKNPEAEAIRAMIMKQLERDDSAANTIQLEAKPESPRRAPTPASVPVLKPSRSDEDKKARKTTAVASSLLRGWRPKNSVTPEFTITRGDDAPLEMLESLEGEFIRFSGSDSPVRNDTTEEIKSPREKIDKRTQIVIEIRASERSYVNNLICVVRNYQSRMLYYTQTHTDSPLKDGFSADDIDTIFSNIKQIMEVHVQFLQRLDDRVDAWTPESTLGDLVLELVPSLKLYNIYGNNYDCSLDALKSCAKSASFTTLMNRCYEKSEKNLKLESLLIAPIQRIPRYILLLNDLRRNTAESHPDRSLVEEAIEKMQRGADDLNKNVQRSQFKNKFVELAQKGAQGLVQKGRSMIYEATVRCERKRKNIVLYIFNDLLVHLSETKTKNKANLLLLRHQWPMDLVWLKEDKEYIRVKGPTDTYKFRQSDVAEWLPQLREAISAYLTFKHPKENVTLTSSQRQGTFRFPTTKALFTGTWNMGRVVSGRLEYMGNVYEGEFASSQHKKQGQGKQKSCFGDEYTGQWQEDRPNGTGTIIDAAGNEYHGSFENGMKSGQGTMKYVSGAVYEGTWVQDRPDGSGSMVFASQTVYAGNWEAGRFHHYGVLTVRDSHRYEGLWHYGLREGTGRQVEDDVTYDGNWKSDLREGTGVETSKQGQYDGEWVADLKEGRGTFQYKNGELYVGHWKRNLFHGQGKFTFASGTSYEGEWLCGRKHGRGVLRFPSGESYDGFFRDDLMHGNGVFSSTAFSLEGKWTRGRLEGKVIYTQTNQSNRKVYHAMCRDNWLTFPENGFSPVEMPSLLTEVQLFPF